MRELLAIIRKEFIHIFRDKITFTLVLAMPIMLVLLLGFTISSEIRNAKISVLDQSKDSQSQKLISDITASGYFTVVSYPNTEADIEKEKKNKQIKAAIIIPPHFEEALEVEKVAQVQVVNDVSDLNVASIINNYLRSIFDDFIASYNQKFNQQGPKIGATVAMLYNPQLNSVYMFVPGIITLVMIIVTALMSSITLARENETNTMRMMLITPVKKIHIVIGKVIPYMIISFFSTIIILIMSVFIFKMPIEGSIALLLLLCLIFLLVSASFGLLISSISKSQLDAMMITMMGLFLPTVLLSGFLFPLDNMPLIFQWAANIFPAKWFILAIKDVMLKGAAFSDIWFYVVVLVGMSVLMVIFSLSQIDKRR